MLGLEGAEQIEAEDFAGEETAEPAKRAEQAKKRRINRVSLPAHLPRVEQIVDIRDKTYPCCRGVLHAIGEDVSECLEHRAGPPAAARACAGFERLKTTDKLFADATTAPVLDPGRGRTKTGTWSAPSWSGG